MSDTTIRSLFDRLAESVGPMAKLPNNGASYHTGEQVITHLNRVLGPDGWSFLILDIGEESDSDECWAYGQITAIIDGRTVVKQDYGSQAFKRRKADAKFISKWDDKKGAATDALKRCARLLGVGLDAWANERAPSWRPEIVEDEPAPPTAPTPIAAPTENETVQQRWARLVNDATMLKLPTLANVKAIDPKACSDRQLASHADRLEARLREVRAVGAA